MGKKKVYSITSLVRNPKVFQSDLPFDITLNGRIIATVVSPGNANWKECENCGENTQNIIEFRDDNANWKKITLCDKCADELL